MLVNLEEFRKRKVNSNKEFVLLPVYERIFLEGDKLIGQFLNGKTTIIHDYSKERK